jgi:hypothetical protein
MLRMALFALVLSVLVTVPRGTHAQECTVSVYGDRGGTESLLVLEQPRQFSIFVVMRAESTVAAAAYDLHLDSTRGLYPQRDIFGPNGDGLSIWTPAGTSVAFTECVSGFGGTPIVIAEYVWVATEDFYGTRIYLTANIEQGDTPVYVTCTSVLHPCDIGPTLEVGAGQVSGSSTSFGRVKSLFVE